MRQLSQSLTIYSFNGNVLMHRLKHFHVRLLRALLCVLFLTLCNLRGMMRSRRRLTFVKKTMKIHRSMAAVQ